MKSVTLITMRLMKRFPKHECKEREIWDAQTLFKAIECCNDPRLKLCLNLAFSCTLRIGELLALTWDCVDISDESIQAGKASISITKELQRVSKQAMKALDDKDIITVFPDQGLHNRTALVLKTLRHLYHWQTDRASARFFQAFDRSVGDLRWLNLQ